MPRFRSTPGRVGASRVAEGRFAARSFAARRVALRLAAAGLVAAAVLSAAGCGRRGGLEFPPGSNPRENTVPANPDKPSGTRAPLEPFVLDPLL